MKKLAKCSLLFIVLTVSFYISCLVKISWAYDSKLINQTGLIDTETHTKPDYPPSFNSSHKTIDPTFGTTLARITGPTGSNAVYENDLETQNLAPVQHFHNPWSYTGNHFLVWSDRLSEEAGSRVDLYAVDRSNFTVTRIRTIAKPVSSMNYNRGVHFDHDNEWIVYAVDTNVIPNTLKRCNLSLDSTEEGLAPNACEILLTDTAGVDQMTQSDNDDIFAYMNSNNKVHKVWKRSTNSYLLSIDCSSWNSVDESQMSPDGKWLFIKGHQISGDSKMWIYDIENGGAARFYDKYSPDYFAGKHSGFGTKWVNETTEFSNYRLVVRSIADDAPGEKPWGDTPRFAFVSPVTPVGAIGSIHPSYSNTNYIYGGFFRATGEPSPWVPYYNEIVRIKDDGSEVLRLAHSWSNFYSNSYDEIPSYASPDGDYVMFYSNWNGQSASARHDVFIVSILDFSNFNNTIPPAVPQGLSIK